MVWAPHEGGPKMDSVLSALLHPDPQRAKNQTLGLPAEEPSSSLLACKPAGMTKKQKYGLPLFLTFKSHHVSMMGLERWSSRTLGSMLSFIFYLKHLERHIIRELKWS